MPASAETAQRRKRPPKTVADLHPSERNPRRITEDQLRRLGLAMESFGDLGGIVFNRRTGRLISGHQRWKQLPPDARIEIDGRRGSTPNDQGTIATGSIEVDGERWRYREVDVDEMTESAMNIAANKHGGEFDPDLLGDSLGELFEAGIDLDLAGFTLDEFAVFQPTADPLEEEPVPPAPDAPKSRAGEIYELGPHRLVCGDATDPDVVRALMRGEAASMIWTDPPYGVSYEGKTKAALRIQNDGADDTFELLVAAFTAAQDGVHPSSPFYIASPAGPQGTMFRLALEAVEWRFHQALVWVKDAFVLGYSDHHYQHEDVLYGHTPGPGRPGRGGHAGTRWYGGHDVSSVLEVARPRRNEHHPTMKPVELILPALAHSSRPGDLVLDPFGGSGSTLAACEAAGRGARLVELDPAYCDVIRSRYAALADRPDLRPGS